MPQKPVVLCGKSWLFCTVKAGCHVPDKPVVLHRKSRLHCALKAGCPVPSLRSKLPQLLAEFLDCAQGLDCGAETTSRLSAAELVQRAGACGGAGTGTGGAGAGEAGGAGAGARGEVTAGNGGVPVPAPLDTNGNTENNNNAVPVVNPTAGQCKTRVVRLSFCLCQF